MPIFSQGSVVRVPFPYTDRATWQQRPALVVSSGLVGDPLGLLWVVMITSAEHRPWTGDVSFEESYREAGLPVPSIIRTCKMSTIEARRAEPLGYAAAEIVAAVMAHIKAALGLIDPNS